MISQEIEFFAPATIGEALAILARAGGDARPLAGGMTLVPMMTLGIAQPATIVSLNHIPELAYVRESGGWLHIGAMTRHSQIEANPLIRRHCPILCEAATHIGDHQVRHRGTIGGSLSHSDPAADYPPVMLALGARMKIRGPGGERIVAASDFFKGLLETDVRAGEILAEIQAPKIADRYGYSYLRLHRIEGSFPIVNAAAIIERKFASARLAMGGVGNTAIVLDVSQRLKAGLDDGAVRKVVEDAFTAAKDAPEDLSGNSEYRRAMARVFAERAIRKAAAALNGN
ncbi:MAG: FAD binding domain-containing protein [Candidatus Binataceae bacterium]